MILACARMHTHHIGGYYPDEPRTVAFFYLFNISLHITGVHVNHMYECKPNNQRNSLNTITLNNTESKDTFIAIHQCLKKQWWYQQCLYDTICTNTTIFMQICISLDVIASISCLRILSEYNKNFNVLTDTLPPLSDTWYNFRLCITSSWTSFWH